MPKLFIEFKGSKLKLNLCDFFIDGQKIHFERTVWKLQIAVTLLLNDSNATLYLTLSKQILEIEVQTEILFQSLLS